VPRPASLSVGAASGWSARRPQGVAVQVLLCAVHQSPEALELASTAGAALRSVVLPAVLTCPLTLRRHATAAAQVRGACGGGRCAETGECCSTRRRRCAATRKSY
jgi:hypothetical protein